MSRFLRVMRFFREFYGNLFPERYFETTGLFMIGGGIFIGGMLIPNKLIMTMLLTIGVIINSVGLINVIRYKEAPNVGIQNTTGCFAVVPAILLLLLNFFVGFTFILSLIKSLLH